MSAHRHDGPATPRGRRDPIRRRRETPRHRGDTGEAGTTLAEVVVGMSIMSVFLAVFTGAIVTLTQTQNHTQALVSSANDVNTAFQRLDSTVRYAAGITAPGTTGATGSWYVEFLTTATGPSVCTQLRVTTGANGQLQSRTWTPTGSGVPTATAWRPLASHVTNGGAVAPAGTAAVPVPFVVPAASASGVRYQQLVVQVAASTGNPAVESDSAMTFTALNSLAGVPTTQCSQVGRP